MTITLAEFFKIVETVKEIERKKYPNQEWRNRPVKDITVTNNFKMLDKMQRDKLDYFDIDAVKKYLTNYSNKTKLNYMGIITTVINDYFYKNERKWAMKKQTFDGYLKDLNDLQREIIVSGGKPTEAKQKSNALSTGDIQAFADKLRNELGFEKDALIVEFLLDHPCRMEVAELIYKVGDGLANARLSPSVDDKNNYLYVNLGESGVQSILISRADYKTAGYYGRVDTKIEGRGLNDRLIKYITDKNLNDGDRVFGYTRQALTKRLHYLSSKYNGGVTISTNSICKIVTTKAVTDAGGSKTIMQDTQNALQDISKKRGTSTSVLANHYLQNITKSP